MVKRLLLLVVLCVSVLAAPVTAASSAYPPSAGPVSTRNAGLQSAAEGGAPCHGYVNKLFKKKGKAVLKYWIYCGSPVDYINVQAKLTRGPDGQWKNSRIAECRDANYCEARLRLRDVDSGRNPFQAYAVVSNPTEVTSYVRNNGDTFICHDNMNCSGDRKYF